MFLILFRFTIFFTPCANACLLGGFCTDIFMRAFVELSKSRMESLANSFAKLCLDTTKDSQHTYVETDSVRYACSSLH